ncbi:hypothetical protein E4U40_006099, partial [Claviceps sp. LM458 group G5]
MAEHAPGSLLAEQQQQQQQQQHSPSVTSPLLTIDHVDDLRDTLERAHPSLASAV